jgi:hypothetical protein
MREGEASSVLSGVCGLGDSHSPVGLAELTCLLDRFGLLFALTKIASFLHYPSTQSTLLRYYTL